MLSRRSVARYTATGLKNGSITREEIALQLAAWLKSTHHNRQADYLVQDIAKQLVLEGYIYATVTTACQIDEITRQTIIAFLVDYYGEGTHIELDEQVDPSVIGGVRIDTPNGSLDSTVRRSLIQIIKGA